MDRKVQSHETASSLEAERFRLLADRITDFAVIMVDDTGRIASWNAGAQRIEQYEAAEVIGRPFAILYPADDQDANKPELAMAGAARQGRFEDEGWRVRKDGTRFWARVVITALRSESGASCGFGVVVHDLTERKLNDEQLNQRDQGLRLLIDSIHEYAIFRLDVDGRIATWNPGAQRIKQYAADEIIGRHFSIFYPEEDRREGQCERKLVVAASEGRCEEEGWRLRKDGSRFWANVLISPLRDEAGTLVGFAKLTRDQTERRQAEQERVGRARAEEAVRMRDEFLSIASHELKTPLTSAQLRIGAIQRLIRGGAPAESLLESLAKRVDSVESELDRLTHLVDRLLDVSRAASGELRLDLAAVDVGAIVRDVAARLDGALVAARCRLRLQMDDGLTAVLDLHRLDQLVTILLSNALKYGPGQPIDLSVRRRDGAMAIEVRDRGIGIAMQDQARIFDRFARAVPESHYGGLGLGLWIARKIVEAMGGTIGVESHLGEGAQFTVVFPVRAPSQSL